MYLIGKKKFERGKRQKDRRIYRERIYLFVFFCLTFIATAGWSQVAGIPAPSYVYDGLTPPDIDYTNSTTSLSANWAPITQYVDGYEVAIGTRPGGTDVVDWTNVGNVTSTTIQTPTLRHLTTYYFSVRGYLSVDKGEIATSDGVTVDIQPPSSRVNPLQPTTNTLTFTVSWSGTDDGQVIIIPTSGIKDETTAIGGRQEGPSGILNYDVQYRDGDTGAWIDWQTETTAISAQFTGVNGHTYYFRCRARDNQAILRIGHQNLTGTHIRLSK